MLTFAFYIQSISAPLATMLVPFCRVIVLRSSLELRFWWPWGLRGLSMGRCRLGIGDVRAMREGDMRRGVIVIRGTIVMEKETRCGLF